MNLMFLRKASIRKGSSVSSHARGKKSLRLSTNISMSVSGGPKFYCICLQSCTKPEV